MRILAQDMYSALAYIQRVLEAQVENLDFQESEITTNARFLFILMMIQPSLFSTAMKTIARPQKMLQKLPDAGRAYVLLLRISVLR